MRYIGCWTLQTIHLTDTVCSAAKTHQNGPVLRYKGECGGSLPFPPLSMLINGLVVISHLPQATFHQ